MTRVGVVLCGCGRFDGSEIHESVLTLLHLARQGVEAVCMAPDRPQWAVCDHRSGEVEDGAERNMLAEAARIARGQVVALESVDFSTLDALILPGGTGAAKNLCEFAEKGAQATVLPALAEGIRTTHAAAKPIGAICIAPAIVALVLGGHRPRLTLGPVSGPALEAAAAGAEMVDCAVEDIVVDEANRLVSTPAYILGPWIGDVDAGIGKLVAQTVAMIAAPASPAPPVGG